MLLDKYEVAERRFSVKPVDIVMMPAQDCFHVGGGAVREPDPDNLRMPAGELGTFVEIGVLGHNCEALLDRVAPDRVIARAFERDRPYVYRSGENA